jgi:hypothetical protein
LDGDWHVDYVNIIGLEFIPFETHGDLEFRFDDNLVLAVLFFLMFAEFNDLVKENLADTMMIINANTDSFVDINLNLSISIPIKKMVFRIAFGVDDALLEKGKYTISWNVDALRPGGGDGIGYFIFDTPEDGNLKVNITISEFEIDIGKLDILINFTIKPLAGADLGDIIVKWDINGDGDGYIFIDTNWEWVIFSLTTQDSIKFYGGFRADELNISWDLDGGIFHMLEITGHIELMIGFKLLLYLDGEWRQLLPLLDGGYIYVYVSETYVGPYTIQDQPIPYRTDLVLNGEVGVSYTFDANHPSSKPLWPDTSDEESIKAYQWSREVNGLPVGYPWYAAPSDQNIIIQPVTWSWDTPGEYKVTLKIKDQYNNINECTLTMNITDSAGGLSR